MKVSKTQLAASICRDSFYDFVQHMWHTVIPEEPVWNWHIKYLCDELQQMAELVFSGTPKENDVVINISPGTTKSTICSVFFPAWVWTRMPSARTICGSYAHSLSLNLSRLSRQCVKSEKYRSYFPEIELVKDQDSKHLFVNTEGGGRMAVSTGGSVTGFHAHFIIVDDPLDPNQALSEADLKTANQWMKETLPTRKVDKKVTVTLLIMQRLHEADPSRTMLDSATEKNPVKHICLPATLPPPYDPENEEPQVQVLPAFLRRRYKPMEGQDSANTTRYMDPIRLDENALDEMNAKLGDYAFAGQFDQNPVPRGGGMFKVAKLQYEMHPPRRWKRIIRYWDKAGTKDGGARTAGVAVGECVDGFFWFIDVKKGQWEAFSREQVIKNTAYEDGVDTEIGVEQEPGSGGKESAEATVRNLSGFKVRVDRPQGKKELRADPLAVQVNGGNCRILKGEWNKDFINEMMYFPLSKYKDQIDAASGAFGLLTGRKKKAGGLWQTTSTKR